MTESSANKKRIAKNTLMLYIRMLMMMAITLYTSRVTLQILGVVDFGIYNIVAGVVVLFSFLNAALNNSSQRYLSIAVGINRKKEIETTFSHSFFLHVGMALILAFVTEIVGLYLFSHTLNIPADRYSVAIIAFHVVVGITVVNIIKVPFNAVIIANERMDFYAYTSVVEAIMKLAVIYLLTIIDCDKLIVYVLLLLAVSIIMLGWYVIFVNKTFPFYRLKFVLRFTMFKEMVSFTGWNLLGGVADVGYKYGTNIILNVFCGVSLNATLGIANQVRGAVFSFVSNLQTAANPQIIKQYYCHNKEEFCNLVYGISKYSFLLMLALGIPLLLNISFILDCWLVNIPPYCQEFCACILVFCLIDSLHGPLWVAMQAAGKLRNTQVAVSAVLLLNLPFTYLALYLGYEPTTMIWIQIGFCIVALLVRLAFLQQITAIKISVYLNKVLRPIFVVSVLILPIPIYIYSLTSGVICLITTSLSVWALMALFTYQFASDRHEREIVKNQWSLFRKRISKSP